MAIHVPNKEIRSADQHLRAKSTHGVAFVMQQYWVKKVSTSEPARKLAAISSSPWMSRNKSQPVSSMRRITWNTCER